MAGRSIRLGVIIRSAAAAAALVACAAAPRAGLGQDWPVRAVTMTQTFAGGGTMDFAIRSIAQAMTETFGQPFIVEIKSSGC